MGIFPVMLLAWLGTEAPVRFTAPHDGILHASLHRGYAQLPGALEVVEIGAAGIEATWAGEVRSFTPENTQTHPGVTSFRAGRVQQGHTYELRATRDGRLDYEILTTPVEAGMSWLIRAADAWLSNQPRHGAVTEEGRIQHPEARACIACHITQFSTRAYLTAALRGYRAPDPGALEAVMRRLRENPRPLPGHPDANWSRVIYSARTVSSRLPTLLALHAQATGRPADPRLILGAARYLRLSDECGAGILRPETDGSRPDVSGFEIGWQTAQTFRLAAAAEPANPDWPRQAACVESILSQAKPTNVVDAAWALIARQRLGHDVAADVAGLLRHQRPDGRFALEFSPTAPAADFVSYHVLYALAVAGHRGPAVDRLLAYTLRQQRPDGSWKGAPEYKGFDTPFRETQFAVMALSELSPQSGPRPAWPAAGDDKPDAWQGDRPAAQRQLLTRLRQGEPVAEQLAATLDENLSQLREWQRTIRAPEQQARVEQALRADSQRQATLFALALRDGPRPLRLGVLTALSTVVSLDKFAGSPRVGNDVEAPRILADADAALERAILACIDPADPELTRAAIRAGTALEDVLTPHFTKAMLRLLPRFGAEVVEAYGQPGRAQLTLSRGDASDPELIALVKDLLDQREPRALSLLLPMLSALEPGHRFTREPDLSAAMERLLRHRSDGPVLQAAGVFADVVDGPLMRSRVLAAMSATDPAVVRAAVDVVLERYLVNPRVVELTLQYLAKSQGLARRMLLDSLDPARLTFNLKQVTAYSPPPVPIPLDGGILSAPFVKDFVVSSLRDPDPQAQAAALDLARKRDVLHRDTAVAEALREVARAGSPRNQAVSQSAPVTLDYDFFARQVQPILTRPGADGRSCAMCHASNARFPLRTDPQANFRIVSAKVNPADPVASPLLVKPLLPGTTTDGDVFRTSHNGGQRWAGHTGSAEYQIILEWIRGAKNP
ncbi:MAG: terpene cyclase/mutase family protein [Bryobacteraceae bacterium]|nr:terpene cyclase/mutase family protein [Bryobacteraceae bacterium]